MMLLIFQCFLIVLLALYWTRCNKEFEKIPGPSGIILLHNTLDLIMDPVKMFYYFRQLCNKYKRLFKLRVGHVKLIIIHNPEDVETVVTGGKNIKKGFVYDFIKPWLQEGLLTSKGSKWHQRRKLLTPAFHFNVLANFKSVIEENCRSLVESLQIEVSKSKTDITPYVNKFAINSICETAMGTKLDEESSSFGKVYKDAIYKLGEYAVYRAQRIWMHPEFIFNMTILGRKQKEILNNLTSFRNHVIEKRRILNKELNNGFVDEFSNGNSDEIEVNSKKKLAMLDLLLKAEKDGIIDEQGIGEEVDTFMFGGHDTSANALQFTMMLLANHQDVQEKVVEECNEIFSTSDRSATMADLAQMKYLECCIKECLRLYPPLPVIMRKVEHPLKLGNYEVPVGTECGILIFDLHRRSDQFLEPQQFRPERFLTEPTWHSFAYIPFSAGLRNCIGQKFAMMELKLALSAVLRRYRILPVTVPRDIIFVTDYVLRTKEHIFVKFEERI